MKGTIIGTDLLEYNNSVKVLEINTNTTFFNEGSIGLDYDALFSVLIDNGISELHFIYNERDAFAQIESFDFVFEDKLKEKCLEHSITYTSYKVPANSVTVPYVEDTTDRFILRQAYDTTALVDETYCADKFEFFNLMSGSVYSPNTYFTSATLNLNTLDTLPIYPNGEPNVIKKAKNPQYDSAKYPTIYKLTTNDELDTLKDSLTESNNFLIQDFIFDEANIVNNRWNIIRSIDIIYGSELDVISMGGYRTSTTVDMDFSEDEYTNSIELTHKSRFKWINKSDNNKRNEYHADSDSLILMSTGEVETLNNISISSSVKTIDFINVDGYSPSDDLPIEYNKRWESTLTHDTSVLTESDTIVQSIISASVSGLYIEVTLEDGTIWNDLPETVFYTELSGSTVTQFNTLNSTIVGDKLTIYNSNTSELYTKEITNLNVVYDSKVAYTLDVEPSDLFLVNTNSFEFAVQHNYECNWCGWYACGQYRCDTGCPGCNQGLEKFAPA
jgi:hypothetical protein